MTDYKAGDRVRISMIKETLEGTLIESSEPGIVILKLKSGYNIGIKKEDITDIEILSSEKEKEKEFNIKVNKNLPNVDVIMTGGTISSRVDYKTGGVQSLTKPEDLFKFYPEIFEIVNVRKIEMPFMKLSENMTPDDWQEIAKICEKSLNDKDCSGVIITHGTDILHYTAAALSFFLKDLNKPVVLTYAQRSSDRASSDASLNLQCAARAAISEIAEVMIVGHASTNDDFCYALRGTKVRKMHSTRRDAFKPINCKPFAKIWKDRIEKISDYRIRNNEKVKLDASFNNKIALVKYYPGMNPEIMDYYAEKYEGIVIEVLGIANVSVQGKSSFLQAIKRASDNGLVICAAPQTIYGRLNPWVYSTGRELLKAGLIYLEDMLPETAYVKLGWVLAHREWKNRIQEKMAENISGELNNRIEE